MHFPHAWGYQLIYKCNVQVREVIMIDYKDEIRKKFMWITQDDPITFLIWPTTPSRDSLSAIQNENGIGWTLFLGFLGSSIGKESAFRVEDLGLTPVFGRSPGEGSGKPIHCSCLENSMDRGACWATVHRILKESDMTELLIISLCQTSL